MHTNKESQPSGGQRVRRLFRDLSPGAATDAELTWFFNEAESAVDRPSNFVSMLAGATLTTVEEVERRAEAIHAARTIHDWLKRLRAADALILAGLYTDRLWSSAVTRALPGGLAGAAHASVPVRVAFVHALARGDTRAQNVADFIEEVVQAKCIELVSSWRDQVEVACALAVRAYERVRRDVPSVVPPEEDR